MWSRSQGHLTDSTATSDLSNGSSILQKTALLQHVLVTEVAVLYFGLQEALCKTAMAHG